MVQAHELRAGDPHPLIVVAPGRRGGQRVAALVEFVDIYPTVCELAGLPRPTHLGGESLVPLLEDPGAAGRAAAFQVYPRSTREHGRLLGHAVRTDRWRCVEWRRADGGVAARELYDMRDAWLEGANLAGAAGHEEVVAEHAALLAAQAGRTPAGRSRHPPPRAAKVSGARLQACECAPHLPSVAILR